MFAGTRWQLSKRTCKVTLAASCAEGIGIQALLL
jgi:hypothetical protein